MIISVWLSIGHFSNLNNTEKPPSLVLSIAPVFSPFWPSNLLSIWCPTLPSTPLSALSHVSPYSAFSLPHSRSEAFTCCSAHIFESHPFCSWVDSKCWKTTGSPYIIMIEILFAPPLPLFQNFIEICRWLIVLLFSLLLWLRLILLLCCHFKGVLGGRAPECLPANRPCRILGNMQRQEAQPLCSGYTQRIWVWILPPWLHGLAPDLLSRRGQNNSGKGWIVAVHQHCLICRKVSFSQCFLCWHSHWERRQPTQWARPFCYGLSSGSRIPGINEAH